MPQASSELHDFVMKKFGDIDCGVIHRWLLDTGNWINLGGGYIGYRGAWLDLPEDERKAANFLVDEWDYGYRSATK